ncbi:MAG: MFS transporter [Oligoflexia bacterium]|nr:MFS transporter [Oligoflexia bacterium]
MPQRALIILTLINILNYIDRWIVAAVIPVMSVDLNLNHTQSGLIMSAFMLGYFATSPLFGYLADRYKRLHVISAGTLVWSITTAAAGVAQNFYQMLASRIVVGVGEASTVSTSQALLSDYYPPQKRSQIMAIFTAAIPVGAALGFVLGGLLSHHYGWRNAFFIAGLPGVLLAVFIYLLKEPKRGAFENLNEEQVTTSFKEDVLILLKNSNYMLTVYGYTAFTFAIGGIASWIPQYLVKVRNIPLKDADMVFGGITVVTGVLGSLFGGWLATYFLKRKARGDLFFVFLLTAIATPLTFACFFVNDLTLFYVLISTAEFFLFATQPSVNVVLLEVVSPKIKSLALAFSVFTIHLLGDLISPPLVGILSDYFSLQKGILLLPLALIPSGYFYLKAYLRIQKMN